MNETIRKIIIYPEATLRDAMKAIGEGEIGISLLVEKNTHKFLRTISDGDIRRALLEGLGLNNSVSLLGAGQSVFVDQSANKKEVDSHFSNVIRIIPCLNDKKQVVDLYFCDNRKNLPVAKPYFDDEEIALVNECIVSGWVSSGGAFVTEFEELVSKQCSRKHAIACSSGTTALHLALLAMGVNEGDEVIVPTLSFIASANAVTYIGAKPVFVDSEMGSWNIDPFKIEEAITPLTKAIMPVHLYGHPAQMDEINAIAHQHNLLVVEDAAEAQGAFYKDRSVGSLGHVATFSFFGNKVITTGEGGMIVTDDDEIASKARILRDHGMSPQKRYWHTELGFNYRMTNLQAAVGVAQMRKFDWIVQKKKNIADWYITNLSGCNGLVLPPNLSWADNVYWLFTILIDEEQFGLSVSELAEVLKSNGIDTRPVFYPMHTQPIYVNDYQGSFPCADQLSRTGLSLPSSPDLTFDDVLSTCDIIRKLSKN
jgi:perosamine synthetase